MQELLAQFAALDPTTQLAILLPLATAVAGGVTWVLRRAGLADRPGIGSNLVSILIGAALGYVSTRNWQGAVIGALTGLAATGAHQVPKQAAKARADIIDEQERLDFGGTER